MATPLITTSFIPRDDNFQEIMEILNKLTSPGDLDVRKYTIKDTNLSSRVVSHWATHNLLPDGLKDKDGWSKFSHSELVWLRVATRLREFGFPLTKIAKVKKQIMVFNPKSEMYPIFSYYVTRAWGHKDDIYVAVLADGTADIGTFLDIELAKDEIRDKNKDMLFVSLKQILKEMGLKTPDANSLIPFTTFSNDPRVMAAVYGISTGNVHDARIIAKEGKVTKIELKRSHQNPEHAFAQVRKMLEGGTRKTITLHSQDNKIIAIDEIEKT